MKISIIIPNYNGEKILEKNLSRVLNSIENRKEDIELIISDDFSADNSVEIIEKFIEKNRESKVEIKLLKKTTNGGFSSNVNYGVKHATGEILVLLNTDVIPAKNFLDPLLEHFNDNKVFAVGCMDESVEGEKIILRGRGKGYWRRGFLIHSAADVNGESNTLWVSGGSGAFKKEIWDKMGGLDNLMNPFYWEDIDLSYRALKSGYKCIFDKKSIVRHEHEKGSIKTKFTNNQVKKTAFRNQFIFVWKNSDLRTVFIHVFWLPYSLLYALFKDRLMVSGFFKALLILPKVISERKKVQKMFILNDKNVVDSVK